MSGIGLGVQCSGTVAKPSKGGDPYVPPAEPTILSAVVTNAGRMGPVPGTEPPGSGTYHELEITWSEDMALGTANPQPGDPVSMTAHLHHFGDPDPVDLDVRYESGDGTSVWKLRVMEDWVEGPQDTLALSEGGSIGGGAPETVAAAIPWVEAGVAVTNETTES